MHNFGRNSPLWPPSPSLPPGGFFNSFSCLISQYLFFLLLRHLLNKVLSVKSNQQIPNFAPIKFCAWGKCPRCPPPPPSVRLCSSGFQMFNKCKFYSTVPFSYQVRFKASFVSFQKCQLMPQLSNIVVLGQAKLVQFWVESFNFFTSRFIQNFDVFLAFVWK